MGATSRTLEVTVISGQNLQVDQNPVKEDAYVVVRAESLSFWSTKLAKQCESTISNNLIMWNEKLLLDMPMHAKSITFEVQCKKSSKSARRPIGVARISISDFLGEDVKENCLHVLSYRLRDWEGRRNGIIHFAVRVVADPGKKGVVAGKKDLIHVGDKNSIIKGIVSGTSIWWKYPNSKI